MPNGKKEDKKQEIEQKRKQLLAKLKKLMVEVMISS